MSKALVVVESPAKAKTLRKYLGAGFDVKASVGHIIDLPTDRMGVTVTGGRFTPEYVPIAGKEKVIRELQQAGKKADKIYLAPDPDREGEAIAHHIARVIQDAWAGKKTGTRRRAATKKGTEQDQLKAAGNPTPAIWRMRCHEITKSGVRQALQQANQLNTDLYQAQQARRILDRFVGYEISPVLWGKVRRGLSAGRVQSVAVRLVVDRERAIEAFKPEEYWSVEANVDAGEKPLFWAKLHKTDGKKAKLVNEQQAHAVKADLAKAAARVASVVKKPRKRRAAAPFITSRLQQDAARALRFPPSLTMRVAQSLYEGMELGDEGAVGLITYMRTDSVRVSDQAVQDARAWIRDGYGKEYLPGKPNFYKNKRSAQDAHEAIRPTSVQRTPESVKPFVNERAYKLYRLIWERFVASQMLPAEYDCTQVDIACGKHELRANGSVLRFAGYLRVYREALDEDDKAAKEQQTEEETKLPVLREGQDVCLREVLCKQHFTEPPPRFSEASLVKELEEKGIGRPSTYAAILSTVQDKGYVEKRERRLHPADLGTLVTDLLVESFPRILDVAFTAGMEERLDEIEEGKADWQAMLAGFHKSFEGEVEKAKETMRDVKRAQEPTDIRCDRCGQANMVIRWGRNGYFLGCANYPDCVNRRAFARHEGKIVLQEEPKTDAVCSKCGSPMQVKRGRFGTFLGCSRYPDCKHTQPMSTGVKCPKDGCEGDVVTRRSKRGRTFYGCNRYPDCDFTAWHKPVNTPCSACKCPYVLAKSSRGSDSTVHECPQCGNKTPLPADDQSQQDASQAKA
ncbi:MAG: type I DNA topoisomerase [Myxococcota bacterium]